MYLTDKKSNLPVHFTLGSSSSTGRKKCFKLELWKVYQRNITVFETVSCQSEVHGEFYRVWINFDWAPGKKMRTSKKTEARKEKDDECPRSRTETAFSLILWDDLSWETSVAFVYVTHACLHTRVWCLPFFCCPVSQLLRSNIYY